MNKAKKVFYTVMTGVVLGAALGVLFAPEEGSETRRKLKRLKQKLTGGGRDDEETLEELRDALQEELDKINLQLAKK